MKKKDTDILALLRDIENCINDGEIRVRDIGLQSGLLGFAMFHYYKHLLTNHSSDLKKIGNYIESALTKLDIDYSSFHVHNEITELGLVLTLLTEEKIIDLDEVVSILDQIDEMVAEFFRQKIVHGNLDLMMGFPSLGLYFLRRKDRRYVDLLISSVVKIEELSQQCEQGTFWQFDMRDQSNPIVELSFGHGVSGVIFYLSLLYQHDIETEKTGELVKNAVRFLLNQKISQPKISFFPFTANGQQTLEYQNLAYGEIGIGYSLYRTGQIFKQDKILEEGRSILIHAAKYRDEDKIFVRDANLIYGACGLYAFFDNINKEMPDDHFRQASEYWRNKIYSFRDENAYPQWAGFKAYFNQSFESTHLGFSQGISGIGACLIVGHLGKKHDYLSFFNFI